MGNANGKNSSPCCGDEDTRKNKKDSSKKTSKTADSSEEEEDDRYMTKSQRKIYTTPVDEAKFVNSECNCKKNHHYCSSKCKDKAWKKEAEKIEMAYAVTTPTGEDDTKQGLVGLFNLGATCFMNSAL